MNCHWNSTRPELNLTAEQAATIVNAQRITYFGIEGRERKAQVLRDLFTPGATITVCKDRGIYMSDSIEYNYRVSTLTVKHVNSDSSVTMTDGTRYYFDGFTCKLGEPTLCLRKRGDRKYKYQTVVQITAPAQQPVVAKVATVAVAALQLALFA